MQGMYSAELDTLEDKQIFLHSVELRLKLQFLLLEADIPFPDLLGHVLNITVKSKFPF